MSLSELMRAMADETGDEARPEMSPAQEMLLLREIVAKRMVEHRFTPGEIIAHKWPENADTRLAKCPHIFSRYLDKPIFGADAAHDPSEFGSNSAARVYDCVVGSLSGDSYTEHLSDSSTFEPAGDRFGPLPETH